MPRHPTRPLPLPTNRPQTNTMVSRTVRPTTTIPMDSRAVSKWRRFSSRPTPISPRRAASPCMHHQPARHQPRRETLSGDDGRCSNSQALPMAFSFEVWCLLRRRRGRVYSRSSLNVSSTCCNHDRRKFLGRMGRHLIGHAVSLGRQPGGNKLAQMFVVFEPRPAPPHLEFIA